MKKLLSLFRKKTCCIKIITSRSRQELEINVNEWVREKNVTPINVSYTSELTEMHGDKFYVRTAVILYKF